MNTLQKLYNCMKNEFPENTLAENVADEALVPIERMLQLTANKDKFENYFRKLTPKCWPTTLP